MNRSHSDESAAGRHPPALRDDLRTVALRQRERRRLLHGFVGSAALLTGLRAMAKRTAAFDDESARVCAPAPEETGGPFPADGSGWGGTGAPNVLPSSGIVRSDIRRSFGSSSTTAPGVPLRLSIRLRGVDRSCAPLAGHAVYVWHCDREGRYSLYSRGIEHENYLRGVQLTDSRGQVDFQTIVPACYAGRYPHVHIEAYAEARAARPFTGGYRNSLLTSQLVLPRSLCEAVYTQVPGYAASAENFSRMDSSSDLVFQRSTPAQLAAQTPSISGDSARGYSAVVTLGVAAARRGEA